MPHQLSKSSNAINLKRQKIQIQINKLNMHIIELNKIADINKHQ